MTSTSYDLKLQKLLSFKSFVVNIISMLERNDSSPKVLEKLNKMKMLKNFMNEQEKNRSGNEKTIEKMILLLESIKQKDKKENQNKASGKTTKPSTSSSNSSSSSNKSSTSGQNDKKYNNERKDHASDRDIIKKKSSLNDSLRSYADVKRSNVDHKSQTHGKVSIIEDSKKKDDCISYSKKDNSINKGCYTLDTSVGHYKNSKADNYGHKKHRENSNLSFSNSFDHSYKSDQSIDIKEYKKKDLEKSSMKAECSTSYNISLKGNQKDQSYQKNEAILDGLISSKIQSVKDKNLPSKVSKWNPSSSRNSCNIVYETIELDCDTDHPIKSNNIPETVSEKIKPSKLFNQDRPSSSSEKSKLDIARSKLKLKPKPKESQLNVSVNKSNNVQRNRLAELLRTNIPTSNSANSSKSGHTILTESLLNTKPSNSTLDFLNEKFPNVVPNDNCAISDAFSEKGNQTSAKEEDSKFMNSREKLKFLMKGKSSHKVNPSSNESSQREQNQDILRLNLNKNESADVVNRIKAEHTHSNKSGRDTIVNISDLISDFSKASTSRVLSSANLKAEVIPESFETNCESVSADFSVDDTPDSPEPDDFNTNLNSVKTIPMEKIKRNQNVSLTSEKDGSNISHSFHQSSSSINCSTDSSSLNNQFDVNSHSGYRKTVPMQNSLKPPIPQIDIDQHQSNTHIPIPSLPLSGDLSKEIDDDLQRAVDCENLETNSALDDSNLRSTNNSKTSKTSNSLTLTDYYQRKKRAAVKTTSEISSPFNPPTSDVHISKSRLPVHPYSRQKLIQPERNNESVRDPRAHGAAPSNYMSQYQPPNNFGNPYNQKPGGNMYAAPPPRIPPPINPGFDSRHFNDNHRWHNQTGIGQNFAPVNQYNQVRPPSMPMYNSPEFHLQRPSSPTPPPATLHQPNRNFTKKKFTSVLLRGVPPFTTSRHIYKFFQDYLLCDMDIPLNNNLEVKGEAYVTFPDSNTAQTAVNELNGYLMNGFQITLSDFSTGFLRSAKAENEFRTAERNRRLRLPALTRGVCNPYYDPKRIEEKKLKKKRMMEAKMVKEPIPESPVSPDMPEIITEEVIPPKIISPVKVVEKSPDALAVKSSEIDKKNRRFRKNIILSDSESSDDEKTDNKMNSVDKSNNDIEEINIDENSHVGERVVSPDNQFSFPDANIEELPDTGNDSEREEEIDDNEPEFEDAFDDSSGSEDNLDIHHPEEIQIESLESVENQSSTTPDNSSLPDVKSKLTKSIKSKKTKTLKKVKSKIPAKKIRKVSGKSSRFVTKMTRHTHEVVDTVCPDTAKMKVRIPSPKKLIVSLYDEKYLNMKSKRCSSRNASDLLSMNRVHDSSAMVDVSNQNTVEDDDSDTEALTIDLDASVQNRSVSLEEPYDEVVHSNSHEGIKDNQSIHSKESPMIISNQNHDTPISLSNSTTNSDTVSVITNADSVHSTSEESRPKSPVEMVAPDSTIRDDDLIMSVETASSTTNNEPRKNTVVDSSQGSCDEIEIISSKAPAASKNQPCYEQSSEITASNSHISIDLESFKSDECSTLPLSKYKNPIKPIAIDDSSSDEIDSNTKQNLERSLSSSELVNETSVPVKEAEGCNNSTNMTDNPTSETSDTACKKLLIVLSNDVDLSRSEDIFSSPNIDNDDDVSDISKLIPSLDDHNSPDIDMSTTKSLLRFIEGNQEVDSEDDTMDVSIADRILSNTEINLGDIDDNQADNTCYDKNNSDRVSHQKSSESNSNENHLSVEKDNQLAIPSKNMSPSDKLSSTHRSNESDDELESIGFASTSSFADNLSIMSVDSRDIQTPDLMARKNNKKIKVTSRRKEGTRVTRGSIVEKELVKDAIDWDDGGVIDLYQCELCPFVGRKYVDHVVNNHSEKVVSCIFKRDDLLPAYRDKVGPQDPVEGAHEIDLDWIPYSARFDEPMVCNEKDCGYDSDLRFDLVYHYLEHYPKALNSIYHCRLCNHITNDFTLSYDHFTSHTGEYRHECNKCGYRTFSTKRMEEHNQSTHNEPSSFNSNSLVLEDKWPYIHVCKVCSYVQIQFSQVEAHNMATHGGKAEVVKLDMFRNIVIYTEKYKAIANKIKNARKIRKSKKLQNFEQKVFVGDDDQADEKEEIEAKLLVDRISLNIYTTRTAGIIKEQMKHLEEINNKLLSTHEAESSNSALVAPKPDESVPSANDEMKSSSTEVDINNENAKEKVDTPRDDSLRSGSVDSKVSDSVTDPLPLDETPTADCSYDSPMVIDEDADSEKSSSEYSSDEYEDFEEMPESESTSSELSLTINRLKEKILESNKYCPVQRPKKKKSSKRVSSAHRESIEVIEQEQNETTSKNKKVGGNGSTGDDHRSEAFQLSCLQTNCRYKCATNEELTSHEMAVHGPFKCSFYFCTFITSDEKQFEQHYQAHPQASKYGCGYGCSATVSSVREIIDHYKSDSCSAVSHDSSMELKIESIMDPKAAARIFGEGDASSQPNNMRPPNSKGSVSSTGASKSSSDPLKTSSPKKKTEEVVIKKEPGLDMEDISEVLPPGFNQLPRDPPTVPILFVFQQYQTDAAFKLFTGKKAADVFKCMFRGCLFTTSSSEEFILHGTAHDDQFRCCYCMLHFTNNDSLTEHVVEEHSHCSFMCKHCLYRSTSTVYLGSHMKKFHPNDPPRYVKVTTINKHPPSNPPVDKFIHAYRCGFDGCQKRTVEAELFKSHVVAAHGAESVLQCFLCSHPAKVYELVEHMRSHMMDEFQCPYCLYGESQRENLTHHLVNCHPGRSGKVLLRKQEQSGVKQPSTTALNSDQNKTNEKTKSSSEKIAENVENISSAKDTGLPSTDFADTSNISSNTSLQDDIPVSSDTGPPPGTFMYQCGNQNCDFSVPSLIGLKEHMQICDNARDTQTLLCKHCKRPFRIVNAFLDHIKLHGPKRYACGVENCSFRVSVQQNYRNHSRYVHGTTSFRCEMKDTKMKDPELQEYILYPKDYIVGSDSKENITKRKRYEYHYEDIDTIPLQSVSSNQLKCFHCKYSTKVRFNLVKHLKLHKIMAEKTPDEIRIKEVPNKQPVNPVPCLQNKEMMFDKMSCLAGSSYEDRKRVELDLRIKNPIPKEEYDNLPCYVPDSSVNVCGVSDCQYTSINDVMLKHHIRALHSEVHSFPCKHCKNMTLTVEKLSSHFKLHGERLYRCGWCTVLSPKRHIIERHVKEKHPSKTPFEFVIREPDETKKEGNDIESESTKKVDASVSEDFGASSEQANEDSEPAKWLCGLCDFKGQTQSVIVLHMKNLHDVRCQYRCGHCKYSSNVMSDIENHRKRHPKADYKVLCNYYRIDDNAIVPFNKESDSTNEPLWKRDKKNKIRHIRGILLDESSRRHKIKTQKSHEMKHPLSNIEDGINEGDEVESLPAKRRKLSVDSQPDTDENKLVKTKEKSDVESLKCNYCGIVCRTNSGLASHIRANHIGRYKCKHCSFAVESSSLVVSHSKSKHPNLEASVIDSNDANLSLSPNSDSDIETLKFFSPQKKSSDNPKLHNCEICPYQTKYSRKHQKHYAQHINNSAPYYCTVCYTRFEDLRHIRSHCTIMHPDLDQYVIIKLEKDGKSENIERPSDAETSNSSQSFVKKVAPKKEVLPLIDDDFDELPDITSDLDVSPPLPIKTEPVHKPAKKPTKQGVKRNSTAGPLSRKAKRPKLVRDEEPVEASKPIENLKEEIIEKEAPSSNPDQISLEKQADNAAISYTCCHCNEKGDRSAILVHMRAGHPDMPFLVRKQYGSAMWIQVYTYICDYCSQSCNSMLESMNHFISNHAIKTLSYSTVMSSSNLISGTPPCTETKTDQPPSRESEDVAETSLDDTDQSYSSSLKRDTSSIDEDVDGAVTSQSKKMRLDDFISDVDATLPFSESCSDLDSTFNDENTQTKKFRCGRCRKSATTRQEIVDHQELKHKGAAWCSVMELNCSVSGGSGRTRRLVKCSVCSFVGLGEAVQLHCTAVHPHQKDATTLPLLKTDKAIHRCNHCSYSNIRAKIMSQHLERSHQGASSTDYGRYVVKVDKFPCPVCKEVFKSSDLLEAHHKSQHKNLLEEENSPNVSHYHGYCDGERTRSITKGLKATARKSSSPVKSHRRDVTKRSVAMKSSRKRKYSGKRDLYSLLDTSDNSSYADECEVDLYNITAVIDSGNGPALLRYNAIKTLCNIDPVVMLSDLSYVLDSEGDE